MGVGESQQCVEVCMMEVNRVWKCRGSQLGVEDVLQEGAPCNYETRLVVICARYVASPAVQ